MSISCILIMPHSVCRAHCGAVLGAAKVLGDFNLKCGSNFACYGQFITSIYFMFLLFFYLTGSYLFISNSVKY